MTPRTAESTLRSPLVTGVRRCVACAFVLFAGIGIAVALLGLTGCRSSPTVAAYVGDQTLTEDRVTALIDGYVTSTRAQATAAGRTRTRCRSPIARSWSTTWSAARLCEQDAPEAEVSGRAA